MGNTTKFTICKYSTICFYLCLRKLENSKTQFLKYVLSFFFMGRYEIVFHDFAATSEKVIKFE